MILSMPKTLADAYRSPSQQARVVTEGWAQANLFCPVCTMDSLSSSPVNTRAVDFGCEGCKESFQLKSKASAFGKKVIDGGYDAFLAALRSDSAPNLFLLEYERASWTVANLMLVPRFALPPSAIERRKPLSSTARRAGWVGCFILLAQIPTDARIDVVRGRKPVSKASIREQYLRLMPIKQLSPSERGWSLDVLNLVRNLGKTEFKTSDMYPHVSDLEKLHPENRHVKEKIRQQLQVLRDSGLIIHEGRGQWRLP